MPPSPTLLLCLLCAPLFLAGVNGAGETFCNLPESGLIQGFTAKAAGTAPSDTTPYTVQLAATANKDDNYYVGSVFTVIGGAGLGLSSRITQYCGLTHTSCAGRDSTGSLQGGVSFSQWELDATNTVVLLNSIVANMPGDPSKGVVASRLQLTLPAVDSTGKTIPTTGGNIACSDFSTAPYMTDYTNADCVGQYKDKQIYIIKGTGAGQVGLIRAGPDGSRNILVTGLLGTCTGGNAGFRCAHDGDCTGAGTCTAPVDVNSVYTVADSPVSSTCNPLCNNVASYTATIDLLPSQSLGLDTVYSISSGCYDTRFGSGMRRLGASGTGAGQQNALLDWRVLIPDGEMVARPAVTADGSVVVATVQGSLTKIAASGVKMWNIFVGPIIGNPAVGSDGTIYFGSGDRNIWAVSDNGVTRWRYTTPLPVQASPLATTDAVYVGDRNGTFYKFNLDGSVAWKFYTKGEIWGGAKTTRDGRVVFGSLDGHLYCLEGATGALVWNYTNGQEIVGTPLIQDTSIVFGTREDSEEYGQIVCLKMDGTERWSYAVTSSVESEPAEGPNAVVYAATLDGKIYAIQADGQLAWKYHTGGTGGVCRRRYTADSVSLSSGDLVIDAANGDATDVVLGAGASSENDYYKDYRATFKMAEGTLLSGQFRAVDAVSLRYVPNAAALHDFVYTDTSGAPTAIVLQFSVRDRMVPGESFSVSLPGILNVAAGVTTLLDNAATVGVARGGVAFVGASGTATGGSVHDIVLQAGTGKNCGSNDLCVGATITFLAGAGAGQTAVITAYTHGSLTARITRVDVAPGPGTTYRIGNAVAPKFFSSYTNTDADGNEGKLTLQVWFQKDLSGCGLCTARAFVLGPSAAAAPAAPDGYYNGHQIEYTGGTGIGQVVTCLSYTQATRTCITEPVSVVGDSTTTYKIGPALSGGEAVTLVAMSSAVGALTYPVYSGLCTIGGTPSTVVLAGTTSDKDIYAGMVVEVHYSYASQTTLDETSITGFGDTTLVLVGVASSFGIVPGGYIKIEDEMMLVVTDDGGSQITVQRAQFGTAETTHQTAGLVVYAFGYAVISSYSPGSLTLNTGTLPRVPTGSDSFKIFGTGSSFDLSGVTRADFTSLPRAYAGTEVPPELNTATVRLLDESAYGPDARDYTGASISITAGIGQGLNGVITAHISSGLATVTWSGVPAQWPKGLNDVGYGNSDPTTVGPSGFRLSFYEITTSGTVLAYTGSSRAMQTTMVPSQVPHEYLPCTNFAQGVLGPLYCSATAGVTAPAPQPGSYTAAPVSILWVGGAWCEAAGGTGWGATSPCVSNGLVVTTSSNKFIYGLGQDGTVQFKFMTGKRIKAPPRCVTNLDRTVTIYAGSSDHYVYKLLAEAPRVLRGTVWYTQ